MVKEIFEKPNYIISKYLDHTPLQKDIVELNPISESKTCTSAGLVI